MIVGITGHQVLGSDYLQTWIANNITDELDKLSVTKAYSCLAAGADQLFAKIVLDKSINLIVVIPCAEYEKTFTDIIDLNNFNNYYHLAHDIVKMPFKEPTGEAFYEASKYLVNEIDLLIAVWDNKPAKGLGGTADVIKYAKNLNKGIFHINLLTKQLKYI